MIRRPPRASPKPSSAASDVYKRQFASGERMISMSVNTILRSLLACINNVAAKEINVMTATNIKDLIAALIIIFSRTTNDIENSV